MTLSSGGKIGSYEIVAPLGAGGMGEVYRARDPKLGREVALKVIPAEFASDPERMARFAREAQVLASLNHPNIAHIYGLEDSGGVRALIMELVEGTTLAERIQQGAIPLEECLGIARQIALALEYAHERGIVHRDLKPANVKVTPDGAVKVLDFGLAKAIENTPAAEDISNSPTLSMAATRAGVILGTAAYMSPEQAKGKSVDRRADIWAFGVVLYEMLVGKQLYDGETAPETLAHVITKDPAWDSLPANTPTVIRHLLDRCLTKDPKTRLQAIGEARIIIERYLANPSASTASIERAASETPASRRILPWSVAAFASAIAALAIWAPWRPVPEPPAPMHLSVESGAPDAFTSGANPVIISPDGERFVFGIQDSSHGAKLYTRTRDQLQAQLLTGTDGATNPFFSPNGQWIAFFADGKLKKVAAQGGAAVTLCDAPSNRGGAWSEDDMIYFAAGNREALSRVSSAGGSPQPVTTLDKSKGEITHRWPQVLPGGKVILYAAHNSGDNFDQGNIIVQVLKTGERKTLVQGAMFPRYLPSGILLYGREGTLFAAPFNVDRLEVTGPPVPFLEHVHMNPGSGNVDYSFSNDGTFVYMMGESARRFLVVDWMDKEGKYQPLRKVPGDYGHPSVSPDGKRLAMTVTDKGSSDIWVYDFQRDTMSRITFGPGNSSGPVWTPDGQRIVFQSVEGGAGHRNLFWARADGTGGMQRLTEADTDQYVGNWSADGKNFAFFQRDPTTGLDLWILPFEGDIRTGLKPGKPYAFLNTPYTEVEPAISTDGRWIAYQSNETGIMEVYVRSFPGPGGKWQISDGGGAYPVWSSNGKELFFRTNVAPARIMAVNYRVVGNSFQNDKPEVWSPGEPMVLGTLWTFGLAPDGKRFAVLRPQDSQGNSEAKNDNFMLILNAFEEVRRLTAASRSK